MDINSLEELQQIMRDHPVTGTHKLSDYEKFQIGGTSLVHDGNTLIVSHNYRHLDPYSANRRVVLNGIRVSLYVDPHRCESFTTTDPDALPRLIKEAAAKARAQCDHDYGRELSQAECREQRIQHFGNCWHVYECSKCKAIFSVDSSG